MINQVTLIGRIGKDPEIRKTQNGNDVMNFTLATTESYVQNGQKQSVTDWTNITFFKPSKFHCDNLKKGSLVYVFGKLKSKQYQKKNGDKATIYYVLANVVLTLNTSSSSGNSTQIMDIPASAFEEEIPF